MRLTLICKIPKANLGVRDMIFMICDLKISLKYPFAGDMNSTTLPCLAFALLGDTSDSWNSSY